MSSLRRSRRQPGQGRYDPYQQQAKRQGYRSRAGYKLLYIQEKYRLIRPGMVIVELGAAPGAWTQVAARLCAPRGLVVACDLLAMEALPGVRLLQGDVCQGSFVERLRQLLAGREVDLVLSDMAPNLSGTAVVDQQHTLELVAGAASLASTLLRPGGALLAKAFQGADFDVQQELVRKGFRHLTRVKPAASRPASRELYLLARDYDPERTA